MKKCDACKGTGKADDGTLCKQCSGTCFVPDGIHNEPHIIVEDAEDLMQRIFGVNLNK